MSRGGRGVPRACWRNRFLAPRVEWTCLNAITEERGEGSGARTGPAKAPADDDLGALVSRDPARRPGGCEVRLGALLRIPSRRRYSRPGAPRSIVGRAPVTDFPGWESTERVLESGGFESRQRVLLPRGLLSRPRRARAGSASPTGGRSTPSLAAVSAPAGPAAVVGSPTGRRDTAHVRPAGALVHGRHRLLPLRDRGWTARAPSRRLGHARTATRGRSAGAERHGRGVPAAARRPCGRAAVDRDAVREGAESLPCRRQPPLLRATGAEPARERSPSSAQPASSAGRSCRSSRPSTSWSRSRAAARDEPGQAAVGRGRRG